MPSDDSLKRIVKLRNFFQSRERNELKILASDCWVDAFVYEDEIMLNTGLLAYCFSKLLDKRHIVERSEWKRFAKHAVEALSSSVSFLEKNDAGNARELLHSLLQETESLSKVLGRYVRSVVEKARLKAATEMYAHGASLGVASAFVNAPKREVADYIGGTKMQDKYTVMPVNERLKKIRPLFGGVVK